MRILNKIIAAALVLFLGVSCFAKTAAVVKEPFKGSVSIYFPYVENYATDNHENFGWDDYWLETNSQTYQHEVATVMSGLAAATYSDDKAKRFATKALVSLKVDKDVIEDYYPSGKDYQKAPYKKNQVAYTFGHKNIKLYGTSTPVVFVLVRGTFGKNEWLSNFNISNTKKTETLHHEGFALAREEVYNALLQYAAKHKINVKEAKVLITGHSRGAAVANLLAAKLDEEDGTPSAKFKFQRNNIFAYTFATPNTVLDVKGQYQKGIYSNIFNIVNPEDVVTKVPLTKWGYKKYGRTLVLVSRQNDWEYFLKLSYMQHHFKAIAGRYYTPFVGSERETDFIASVMYSLAPSVTKFYEVPKDAAEDKNTTSIHAIAEYMMYDNTEDAASLGSDLQGIAKTYFSLLGIDNSKTQGAQGIQDTAMWIFSCMHATQTYIAWMKTPNMKHPEYIYRNYDVVKERANAQEGEEVMFNRVIEVLNPSDIIILNSKGENVLKFNGRLDREIMKTGLHAEFSPEGDIKIYMPGDDEYKIYAGDLNLHGAPMARASSQKLSGPVKYNMDEDDRDDGKLCFTIQTYDLEGNLLDSEKHIHNYDVKTGVMYEVLLPSDVSGKEVSSVMYKK